MMNNSRSATLKTLMNLPLDKRIEAVAKDLKSEQKFSRIDPHDLAEALGVSDHRHPGGDWDFIWYAPIVSAEKYAQNTLPASEIVYLIQQRVSKSRFNELLKLSEPLDNDSKPKFGFLKKLERAHLERAIAEKQLAANMSNGMNCIARLSVKTKAGRPLRFEGDVEDDGDCISLRTPYDYKKGKFQDLTHSVTGN